MCKRNILVQEKFGVVSSCDSCGIIDLTFGNFSLQLTEDDYRLYFDFINSYCRSYANCKRKNCRNIKINTLLDNLQLIVCFKELQQLQEIMSTSLLILDAESLIN